MLVGRLEKGELFSSLVWYLAWWPQPAAKFTTWKSGQDHLVFIILVSSSSSRRSYCWARSPLATCQRRGRHPSGHHLDPGRTPGWLLRWRSFVSTWPGRSGTRPGKYKVLFSFSGGQRGPQIQSVIIKVGWTEDNTEVVFMLQLNFQVSRSRPITGNYSANW